MLKIILVMGFVVFSVFSAITFYACCVVASRADRMAEAAFYKYKKNGKE